MADTSAGGWVRRAFRSSANTRPWASLSGTSSAGSGTACANTRSSASATDSKATALRLPRAIMAALAAALFDEPDALDPHAALDRLHHVVDGETGDRNRGQRFHLDAGLPRYPDFGAHRDAGQLGIGRQLELDLRQRQRMTERNQFVRPLCRHDAGNARRAEHVAFFGVAALHELERLRPHVHAAFGDGDAFGRGFSRDVNHAGVAARAKMGEFSGAPRHGII